MTGRNGGIKVLRMRGSGAGRSRSKIQKQDIEVTAFGKSMVKFYNKS